MTPEAAAPWLILLGYVRMAMVQHPPASAARIAACLDAEAYRLRIRITAGPDGHPDPDSLTYVIELPCDDGGWAGLCAVHHSRLGLTSDVVRAEVEHLLWQHGHGIPDTVDGLFAELDRPGPG